MSEPLVVVEENHGLAAHFGATKPVSASSPEQIDAAMTKFVHGAVWVARAGPIVKWLAAMDPTLTVERGVRYVDDGIVSSAGVSAGIDMAFAVVDKRCGREVAEETARYIEYCWEPGA